MNQKKIVVPEGMRVAVAHAVYDECGRCDYHPQIRVALESALYWLSENPIEPTQEQSRAMLRDLPKGLLVDEVPDWLATEWQRRMFVAPEPELSDHTKRIIRSFMGLTLTPEEADAIVEQLKYVAHGWSLPTATKP